MSIEEAIKITKEMKLPQKTVVNLLYTGNWINEKSSEFMKPYGISTQQYNVLRILRGQQGRAVNLCTVQERMISKMSNTTRLIDKLCTKELVTRKQCESNRRKIEIEITAKGLELLSVIDKSIESHETNISKNLSKQEAEILNELLDKLRF